jgi:hypothetical protein
MPKAITRAPLAAVLALAALAAGCAHVSCPGVGEAAAPVVASAPVCNSFLDEGQRCRTIVHANREASSTSLVVVKGQRYQVQVAPGQQWFDARRCSSPPHGDTGHAGRNLLRRFRQDDADWFALMAAVTRGQDGGRLGPGQSVEREPVVEVQRTGILALYPNDVPGLYWNNKGEIVACIERLAPGAAPLSAPQPGEAFCAPRR